VSLTCSWINDKSDEVACGLEGNFYNHQALCEAHLQDTKDRVENLKRSAALQSAKIHGYDKFPGFCYFALLPDGCVKIGYSNTIDLLNNRIKVLSREYKAPVVPLKIISGGFIAEAVMHDRFKHLRLPGNGERFQYGPDIAEFVASDDLE